MGVIVSKSSSSTVTTPTTPQEIIISHLDDSIRIGDGTDLLAVNPDGSLNVNIGSATISGEVDAIFTGLNEYQYNEVTNIAVGAEVTVVSKSFAVDSKLRKINATGSNIAVWTVLIDSTAIDKTRSNYTDLNASFDYETGITIPGGSTIYVKVLNAGTAVGDFSARLLFSPK